ncbi:MAG: hypothetical protein Q9227_001281 [Pyrenula ochraceoflavens]
MRLISLQRSEQDAYNQSQIEVSHRHIFDRENLSEICKHGPLDGRMGTSKRHIKCDTCHESMKACNGHFGYVKLVLPVFHAGYFKRVIAVLQSICKSCSRILLPEEDRRKFLRLLRTPNMDNLKYQVMAKRVLDQCRKNRTCTECGAMNGQVRKAGSSALKITHDTFKAYNMSTSAKKVAPPGKLDFDRSFAEARKQNPEIEKHMRRAMDDLNPLRVLKLFRQMSTPDCELLGFQPGIRPEMYLWQSVPAPPIPIRPTQGERDNTIVDDVTQKLSDIVGANVNLKEAIRAGVSIQTIVEFWDYLSLQAAMYLNSEIPGLPKSEGGKPIRSFVQRLKGKGGRFRGNLSGKRVDYSGRTVISPDPNLNIDEVAIPPHVAKRMTYPERVTSYNIVKLRKSIMNGPKKWPGANSFMRASESKKMFLSYGVRERTAASLREGDIVYRHLEDGDIVLFNRQPSLHKLSIMSHYVRVRRNRTFRLNECVCEPYNADFDGDEMNLHVPQTEESRIEAMQLMGVKNNILTPKNGSSIISAIQDFVTTSYLISSQDILYDRKTFINICIQMLEPEALFELPPPSILKPQMLWTGKQIFNVLMKANQHEGIYVNLDAECRDFKAQQWPWLKTVWAPDMTTKQERETVSKHPGDKDRQDDNHLCIRNSEVMCGRMDKATVGSGKKNSLFYVLYRDFGPDAAARGMNRLSKLSARWLTLQGFSVGINDVTPNRLIEEKKTQSVKKAFRECSASSWRYNVGETKRRAGLDEAGTLESEQVQSLSAVRTDLAGILNQELSKHNTPMVMATSGSKGSNVNVAQMMVLLGQQDIEGKRVQDGFQDRTLPHFAKHARTPASKGFIANSFFSGLKPYEFLFHAVGGRVGLVDTAVKTAETGYMSRRLMKSLEDLSTQYDNTVRNSTSNIIQFQFGDDKLDPVDMEASAAPVNFDRTFTHVLARTYCETASNLLPKQIQDASENVLIALRQMIPRQDHKGRTLDWHIEEGSLNERFIDSHESARGFYDQIGDFLRAKAEALQAFKREKSELESLQWTNLAVQGNEADQTVPPQAADQLPRGSRRTKATSKLSQTNVSTSRVKRKLTESSSVAKAESPNKRPRVDLRVQTGDEAQKRRMSIEAKLARHAPPSTGSRFDLTYKISNQTITQFIRSCVDKYKKAQTEPGHAVGAVGAQSIGEPGTQMTLKTFHFAGVAGMSLTAGVPRIKEIINASRDISTPVITCALTRSKFTGEISERFARIVKGRIECLTLGDITSAIKLKWSTNREWFIRIYVATTTINELGLDLTVPKIIRAIQRHRHFRSKDLNILPVSKSSDDIVVVVDKTVVDKKKGQATKIDQLSGVDASMRLRHLQRLLPSVHVLGHQQASRVVVNAEDDPESEEVVPRKKRYQEELLETYHKKPPEDVKTSKGATPKKGSSTVPKGKTKLKDIKEEDDSSSLPPVQAQEKIKMHKLLVEGYGLRCCMNTDGVDGHRTETNSVMETFSVLGIEAARAKIISELQAVMKGLNVDPRHLALLADVMTFKGEVLGITRFGLAKTRDSVLQLASFEKTADHVFDAGIMGKTDKLDGVSECVIVGKPMPIGTGSVNVVRNMNWSKKAMSPGATIFNDFWRDPDRAKRPDQQ